MTGSVIQIGRTVLYRLRQIVPGKARQQVLQRPIPGAGVLRQLKQIVFGQLRSSRRPQINPQVLSPSGSARTTVR